MVEMCHLGLGKESNSCMRVCVLSNAIATHSTTFIPGIICPCTNSEKICVHRM